MVNSKKNTKSIIALVVLSILLIASICLAATGAWFTDKVADGDESVSFGKIDIEYKTAFSVTAGSVVMPGDTITVNGEISNKEEAAYIGLDISVTVAGRKEALQSEKKVVEVAKGDSLKLSNYVGEAGAFTLTGADYNNSFQDKAVTVVVKICAVQQKNITLTGTTDAEKYTNLLSYVTTNGENQGPTA